MSLGKRSNSFTPLRLWSCQPRAGQCRRVITGTKLMKLRIHQVLKLVLNMLIDAADYLSHASISCELAL